MPNGNILLTDSLREVLTSGCDERIYIRPETGLNKYHLDPVDFKNLHFRGSCTSGTLTPHTWDVALRAMERLESESMDEDAWAEEQRSRLRELLGYIGEEYDIFFAPSGSDLMYYPTLFRRMIDDRPILNIVSCPEELGSGSKLAAEGRFYSQYGPFKDRLVPEQFISSEMRPEVIQLGARTLKGKIRERSGEIGQLLDEHLNQAPIVNLVFGSKSGIMDDLKVIDPDLDVLWTVDLCQFRAESSLIHGLIDQGAMVLITGSKFYNAPPFCGALLVPRRWSNYLIKGRGEVFKSASRIFAVSDVPPRFKNIRRALTQRGNSGSRLRWDCALAEMEAYAEWPRERSNAMIDTWNKAIMNRLTDSLYFEPMPDQSLTNASIISFRVKRDGVHFTHEELGKLFERFVTRRFADCRHFNKVFIGQPVRYGERSFIRIALGSWSVRQMMRAESPTFEADFEMIRAMEREIENFENLTT